MQRTMQYGLSKCSFCAIAIAFVILGIGAVCFRQAYAAEAVLLDKTVSLSKHHTLYPNPVTNFKDPVNYINEGRLYIRYHATKLASEKKICQQICFWCKGLGKCHACTNLINITKADSTYFQTVRLNRIWNAGAVTWESMLNLSLTLKRWAGDHGGAPKSEYHLYYPFEEHATVIIVSADAEFSGWENYPIPGVEPVSTVTAAYCANSNSAIRIARTAGGSINAVVPLEGNCAIALLDAQGTTVAAFQGNGPATHNLRTHAIPGLYILKITGEKNFRQTVVLH